MRIRKINWSNENFKLAGETQMRIMRGYETGDLDRQGNWDQAVEFSASGSRHLYEVCGMEV